MHDRPADSEHHRPAVALARAAADAVVYLRVSTKEQAERDGDPEGYSIPAQRDACLRKAEALGAAVVEEFVDRGESARSANRPELQRLLRYLTGHPVQYVIVHKVDRLARSRADDVTINLAIQQAGARLVSVTENIDDTPSGILLHGIMSSIAEFYSRNLGNEVLKGLTKKAETGGTPGWAPVGYRNLITTDERGREMRTVVLDEERAGLMRIAFEAYATGEWTTRTLLDELTRRGLTTRRGKPLVQSHFIRLLKHPYYKGVVRYRGVEYPGRHEPLVDAETWQRVQDVLVAHNYAGEKRRIHHHYLKGSVFCGHCGSRLVVTHATNRHGTTYAYFVCVGRKKRQPCPQRAVLIERVEELVEDHYQSVQLASAERKRIRAHMERDLTTRTTNLAAERDRQATRRRALLDERQKLLQAHYAGAVPLDLLKSEQQRIGQELAAAEACLGDSQDRLERALLNLDQVLELIGDCHRAYLTADPAIRRQFNQAFFTALYIHDDETVEAKLAEPFGLLLDPRLRAWADARELPQRPTGERYGLTDIAIIETNQPPAVAAVGGWNIDYLVEVLRRYSNLAGLDEMFQCAQGCLARASGERHPRRPAAGKRYKVAQRLDDGTVAELVADYEAGTTSTVLMQRYGLGHGTVLRLLAVSGVTMRHQGLSEAEAQTAAALYSSGLSVVGVADRLGHPMSTVYRALMRSGVVMRPRQGGRR